MAIHGVEHVGAVDHGGTGIEIDGDAQGFGDLVIIDAKLHGLQGVEGDAAIATRRYRDRQRDQLTRLGVEVVGLCSGSRHQGCAFKGIGGAFGQLFQSGTVVKQRLIPVDHLGISHGPRQLTGRRGSQWTATPTGVALVAQRLGVEKEVRCVWKSRLDASFERNPCAQ